MSPDDLRAQFEAFLDEAHRVKKQYAEQITILVGLETEYITEADLTGLSSILSDHGDRIEYVVGSIHHVGGIPIDFDLATFTKALNAFANSPPPVPLASDSGPPEQVTDTDADAQTAATTTAFLCAYLDAQYTLMQRFHPEIIGHFDLCRLYTPTLRFASHPAALDRVRRNVRYAVEYGALFELNAAAFRKGWDAAYPGEDVVEVCVFLLVLACVEQGVDVYVRTCRSYRRRAADSRYRTTATGHMLLDSTTTACWSTCVEWGSRTRGCWHLQMLTQARGAS